MKNLHAKSPCCRGRIIRFGKRRRQCASCKHTWRIRRKKRGRKSKRARLDFFLKYLNHQTPSLYALAKIKTAKSEDRLQRELKSSLRKFLKLTPWPDPSPLIQPVIAVADAMIFSINGKSFTFYFIILKPIGEIKAVIMKPYCLKGKESWIGWQKAFQRLPKPVLRKICALVSDGHAGLLSAAKQNHWLIQRCNFHIIAKIQGRRSRWLRSRHRETGERLYRLLKEILTNPDESSLAASVQELKLIGRASGGQLARYLSGFAKHYQEYRTYLRYPELNLPRTSNSAEAIIGGIRKLCNRAHGFRTIKSLTLWIHAYVKRRRTITCNGYLPTKLPR